MTECSFFFPDQFLFWVMKWIYHYYRYIVKRSCEGNLVLVLPKLLLLPWVYIVCFAKDRTVVAGGKNMRLICKFIIPPSNVRLPSWEVKGWKMVSTVCFPSKQKIFSGCSQEWHGVSTEAVREAGTTVIHKFFKKSDEWLSRSNSYCQRRKNIVKV